jgi:N-acetylneuraminate synthase
MGIDVDSTKRKLIAEIGINHDGDIAVAEKLVSAAAGAGCDAVKFQYRNLSRSYTVDTLEIGDEILKYEIEKNYLSPQEIITLVRHAHGLGLEAGISFFDTTDIPDFLGFMTDFDFFKVPSVELTNLELINAFLDFGKLVYISTGAHTESQIEEVFSQLPSAGWIPLHCVSNYPTIVINSKLGYISHLKSKWGRDVGYSSHDANWETNLVALSLGATVIERHITFDKKAKGLDHSTSSTPDEFEKLSLYLRNFDFICFGNSKRIPNQGEIMNLQNLGKSYYSVRDIEVGSQLNIIDFEYRHPKVGISKNQIRGTLGKTFKRECKLGSPLTDSHFENKPALTIESIDFCVDKGISLPVRLHDYEEISREFPINNYELHLSFGEIDKLDELSIIDKSHRFSIHLPDYLNSNELLDPFSQSSDVRKQSLMIIEKIAAFANSLNGEIPTTAVASFSKCHSSTEDFYNSCIELQNKLSNQGLQLAFQWLPPFAWYFGGSEEIQVMNSIKDLDYLRERSINVCLDTSHLLMGSNYFGFDPYEIVDTLSTQIKHFHLADARGFDGEGFQLGQGDDKNLRFLLEILIRPEIKVIEVWQGHLNKFEGFYNALNSLNGLLN